jgi:hypothetical protein
MQSMDKEVQRRKARPTLVSGSAGRVKLVSAALEEVGFSVIGSESPMGSGSLDCYVQLPKDVRIERGTVVERVGEFLAGGLLARFKAAAAVLPALRPGATVVLVDGHRPPHDDTPDDPHARFDLLRVLGQAVVADREDTRTFVVGSERSPEEIARVAAGRGQVAGLSPAASPNDDPDLSYADWKREVLSHSGPEDWERAVRRAHPPTRYLGWTTAEHRRAVVSLRGAVVSPLPTAGSGPAWGQADPTVRPLARALLRDALHTHTDLASEATPCPACTQVDRTVEALIPAFAQEVLARVPAEEFSLAAEDIRSWAENHRSTKPSFR